MPSPAITLRDRLDGVRRILVVDKRMDDPVTRITGPRKRVLVGELRASCIILPVAYFEQFLRDLVSHFVGRLCSGRNRVRWDDLPERLRSAVLRESGESLRRIDRIIGRQPSEAEMLSIYGRLSSPAESQTQYEIPYEVLCDTGANPMAEQLTQLMSRLGVTGVFPKVAKLMSTYGWEYAQYSQPTAVKNKLDDIVRARHRAAHGGGAGNKSRDEIDHQIDFIEKLAKALQQTIQDHVRALKT